MQTILKNETFEFYPMKPKQLESCSIEQLQLYMFALKNAWSDAAEELSKKTEQKLLKSGYEKCPHCKRLFRCIKRHKCKKKE